VGGLEPSSLIEVYAYAFSRSLVLIMTGAQIVACTVTYCQVFRCCELLVVLCVFRFMCWSCVAGICHFIVNVNSVRCYV